MAEKVKLKINLMQVAKTQITNPKILKAISPILKRDGVQREFGNRVIDEIVKRTREQNIDKKGKTFAEYSTSYRESEIFKIYGKSAGDINLTLSGEMLANMAVVKTDSQGPLIEFLSNAQNDKAHGHIHGIKRKKGGKVVRDFFGLPEKIQADILMKTLKDFNLDPESFDILEGLPLSEIADIIAEDFTFEP